MTWSPIPRGTIKHRPPQKKRTGLDWSKHTQPKLPGTEALDTPRQQRLAESERRADQIEQELDHRGAPRRKQSESEKGQGIWALKHGQVIYLFRDANWPVPKIAKALDCNPVHVRRILDRWEIPR